MEIIEEESVDDDEEELDDEEDMSIFELLIITEPECFGDSTKGEVLRVLFGEEEALIGFLSCWRWDTDEEEEIIGFIKSWVNSSKLVGDPFLFLPFVFVEVVPSCSWMAAEERLNEVCKEKDSVAASVVENIFGGKCG